MAIDPSGLPLVVRPGTVGRITAAQAKQAARAAGAMRIAEVDRLIDEFIDFGKRYGYNSDIMIGQTHLETNTWRSEHWADRLNPGGIGVTDEHDFGIGFATGTQAARAMAVHFMAYAKGHDNQVSGYIGLDPRFVEVHKAGFAGIAVTLADLGNGRWATDPDYPAKVAGRVEALSAIKAPAPPPPAPVTPPAPITGKLLVDVNATAAPPLIWVGSPNYWARAVEKPWFVTHHCTDAVIPGTNPRQLAGIESPSSWLKSPASQASCHILIDRDGTSYQLVGSGNAAWTNGDVQGYRRDIPLILEALRSGHNANHYTFNIEYHTLPELGITEDQLQSGAEWANYVCNKFGVSRDRKGQLRHADLNGVTRQHCPGPKFPLSRLIEGIGGSPTKLT